MQADAGSENVVYLVDASTSMLQTAGIKDIEVRDSEGCNSSTARHQKEGLMKSIRSQGCSEDDIHMDLALKVIREMLKQHVIGSPKDQMAVIFYNAVSPYQILCDVHYHSKSGVLHSCWSQDLQKAYTATQIRAFSLTTCCHALQRQAKNSSDFPNIHIFHELEGTTAQRIKEVEMLQGEATSAYLTRRSSSNNKQNSSLVRSLNFGRWSRLHQAPRNEISKADSGLPARKVHETQSSVQRSNVVQQGFVLQPAFTHVHCNVTAMARISPRHLFCSARLQRRF